MTVLDAVSPFAGSPISSPGGLLPPGMLPSGYIEKLVRDTRVVAHGSTMPHFESMLQGGRITLHQWAASQPGARALAGGRETAWATTFPETDMGVVVRHCTHGGMLASITSDVFLQPRAAHELRVSWTLRHVGIPTPRVIGYALYPVAGKQLWRADVMTREVVDSRDLATVLSGTERTPEMSAAIEATVVLLRRMSKTWAYHRDLNLRNILITTGDDEALVANVIDVDTLRFAEKNAEWKNVARLLRSARKTLETQGGPGLAALIERLGG